MATSGSANYSVNRTDLIHSALRVVGATATGQTPSAEDYADANMALNMMVKNWHGKGIQLFSQKRATLFMQKNDSDYSLGPTGDHGTHSYTQTTMRVAAAASATTLEVTSTTGMAAADYIGIVLDSGSVHWTTVSSVTDSDTVVITSGLASAAAAARKVWFYRTKMYRPIDILECFYRDTNGLDYPVRRLTRSEYWEGSFDKNVDSNIVAYYYDPQFPNGVLYTKYQTNDVNITLELVYRKPFEDFDSPTDEPDFPYEWFEALKFGLAMRLAPEYGMKFIEFAPLAEESFRNAFNVYTDSPRYIMPTQF